MPTAITSSLNTTPKVPFSINTGSFFRFRLVEIGSGLATCSFFPSFSAVPHPTQNDDSTFNGFYIKPDFYSYTTDTVSNRECYRLDRNTTGTGVSTVGQYQGIPFYFHNLDEPDPGTQINFDMPNGAGLPPVELNWAGGGVNDVINAGFISFNNWDETYATNDVTTAQFQISIRIDADPNFPQRLYSGILDFGLMVYNDDKDYSQNTEPNNWYRLTSRAFQPALQTGVASFTDTPPLAGTAAITNIEIGPGLSGSYVATLNINAKSDIFYNGGNQVQIGLVGRFSFLTDAPPPPPSQNPPELWLISIAPNGTVSPIQKINDTPFVTGNNSFNKTIQLSSSVLQVEDYRLGIAAKYYDGLLSPYFSSLNITNFDLNTNTAAQSNTPDEVAIGSAFTENFTNNDWNALFGNAFTPRDSQYFMDVDYSDSSTIGSSLTPINFDSIIEGFATRAPIQDYYYNLQRHTIPRYDGSRSNAPDFNSASNDDSGYGDEIVAGNPKPFVGYYTSKGGSTPEVMGKTIVNLDYIIDENLEVQVPALSDFTYNNQVQLFERGKFLYIDPDKNSVPFPLAGNSKYKIYRSGEYASPVVYSQTGSISSMYLVPTMSFFDFTGSQISISSSGEQNNGSPTNDYIVGIWDNSVNGYNSFYDTTLPANGAPSNLIDIFGNYPTGSPIPNPTTNPSAYRQPISGSTVGRIRLNPKFTQAFNNNSRYISIPGSGYYDVVDYFNLGPIYPEVATIPEYEIRFNADERLSFPIISVDLNTGTNLTGTCIDLYISIPPNFESIYGTFPLPTWTVGVDPPPSRPNFYNTLIASSNSRYLRNRFLIRHWTPRAGYIYLDVDAPLGKGIIKPEFITKGIESKIPFAIKNLTEKGLIQ
jgi:hypothetical protein